MSLLENILFLGEMEQAQLLRCQCDLDTSQMKLLARLNRSEIGRKGARCSPINADFVCALEVSIFFFRKSPGLTQRWRPEKAHSGV